METTTTAATTNDVPPGHLRACGNTLVGHVEGRPAKRGNNVDGARFVSYDPVGGTLTLRVDDSQVPEFWLVITIAKRDIDNYVLQEEISWHECAIAHGGS